MWLWESELRELGFKRKSPSYWQCERGFGLQPAAHLSVYSWSEQAVASERKGPLLCLVEVSAFHVTFELGLENFHFYYHEILENEWQPAGHTSSGEICRLGCDPVVLRYMADESALALVEALKAVFRPRHE